MKTEFSINFPGLVLSLRISASPTEHGHFDLSLDHVFPAFGNLWIHNILMCGVEFQVRMLNKCFHKTLLPTLTSSC